MQEQREFTIDKAEVMRYLGYKNQTLSEELSAKIDFLIEKCSKAARPKWIYRYFGLEERDGKIFLKNSSLVFEGKDIYNHLAGARYCAVMAITAGAATEAEILRAERISMTDAVIFDAAANAYIESAADYVEKIIVEESRQKGLYTNYRYSPGYGDFPIDTQKRIIPALECEKRIGLTVTENSIMIPRKSVTAVIGVFDKEQIRKKGCNGCNMYHRCTVRKGGGKCDKQ